MQSAIDLSNKRLAIFKNPKWANMNWCPAKFGIPPALFTTGHQTVPAASKLKGPNMFRVQPGDQRSSYIKIT